MSTEDNDAPIRGFTQEGTPVLVSESDDVFSPPLKDHAGAETPAGQSTSSPRTVIANKASVSDQNFALSLSNRNQHISQRHGHILCISPQITTR